jgi:MFS transporter, DHA1 family, inner membrane transport protein
VQVSGQFLIITYMGPLLTALTGADASVIAIFFALYGVGGFLGSIAATRIVGRLGAYKTSGIAVATILAGVLLWALGSGAVIVMGIGAGIWGLGFAAANSMQQARLYAAAPPLASVTVALNSSAIYVGQAIGSAIGGVMFARAMRIDMGFVAAAFVAASLGLWLLTRPRHAA